MEIDLSEAAEKWALVCLWLLAGVAGLVISILIYLRALGR